MKQRPASPQRSDEGAKRAKRAKKKNRVLGWREWVALPDLGVKRIKAKLDTGARTSSLHVTDLERFQRGNKNMVRFAVHPVQRSSRPLIPCEAEVLEERRVRSSTGHSALRPVIQTTMRVLGLRCTIEVTLASRDQMGFRMLLGRRALRKSFHVAPGRSFLSDVPGAPPRKAKPRKAKSRKTPRKS